MSTLVTVSILINTSYLSTMHANSSGSFYLWMLAKEMRNKEHFDHWEMFDK